MTDADARAMLDALGRRVNDRLTEMSHAYPDVSPEYLGDLIRGDLVLHYLAIRIAGVEAAAQRAGHGPYGLHAYLWPPSPPLHRIS
jgi:hypothetical protein